MFVVVAPYRVVRQNTITEIKWLYTHRGTKHKRQRETVTSEFFDLLSAPATMQFSPMFNPHGCHKKQLRISNTEPKLWHSHFLYQQSRVIFVCLFLVYVVISMHTWDIKLMNLSVRYLFACQCVKMFSHSKCASLVLVVKIWDFPPSAFNVSPLLDRKCSYSGCGTFYGPHLPLRLPTVSNQVV